MIADIAPRKTFLPIISCENIHLFLKWLALTCNADERVRMPRYIWPEIREKELYFSSSDFSSGLPDTSCIILCSLTKWVRLIFCPQKSSDEHEKRSRANKERRNSIEGYYWPTYCNSKTKELIEVLTHLNAEAHLWHPLLRPAG
jgi:hypothetical protein